MRRFAKGGNDIQQLVSELTQTCFDFFSERAYEFSRAFPKPARAANVLALTFQKSLARLENYSKLESVPFGGRWVESVESRPANEIELARRLVSSFSDAKRMQTTATLPYRPSGGWMNCFDSRLRNFYEIMSRKDYEAVAGFLRNFFRNEGISGLWSSDDNPFQTFRNLDTPDMRFIEGLMIEQYLAWRDNLPSVDLKELDAPRVGNPWGFRFNEYLLYEPVFEYNYQAHYFDRLLEGLHKPVVIEIGGGFGGLAYHLLRCRPSVKYIGFDLPENTLVQTYYLSCIFPDARIYTYQKNTPTMTLKWIDDYDIILLPNFELTRTDSLLADLIVNVRSLSEMSYETITEYLKQIDRVGRLYFFHENIFKARKDGHFGIPSSNFPSLTNFVQISACESRWPRYNRDSAYPCQENLFIRRIEHERDGM